MAYTKILVIHNRLDKCVGYTQDPEKTSLEAAIDYALDREKTEQTCFETAVNCDRESVYADMMDTKRRWGKEGRKRKGYHIIQSFAPGEVTPDQAHAVGVEFARRLLGDRYEAVVSTHLNKAHLHSHIVFNSVSFVDGAMYRDQLKDYYGGDGVGIRGTSDAICREHGLSIIEPSEPLGGPVSRAEWEAARQGKATVRDLIRQDVDEAIRQAYTYQSFLSQLRRMGYRVKTGPRVKHTAILPPGGKGYIRLDSLKDGYTEADIQARLAAVRSGEAPPDTPPTTFSRLLEPGRRYRVRGGMPRRPRKLTGFQALCFQYLCLLGAYPKRRPGNRAAFSMREELLKLDRYQEQFRYLRKNRIETAAQLSMQYDAIQAEIDALTERRGQLYRQKRRGDGGGEIQTEIEQITTHLRALRRDLKLCARIEGDIPKVRAAVEAQRPDHARRRPYEKLLHADLTAILGLIPLYQPTEAGSIELDLLKLQQGGAADYLFLARRERSWLFDPPRVYEPGSYENLCWLAFQNRAGWPVLALFLHVEKFVGGRPWGSVTLLDYREAARDAETFSALAGPQRERHLKLMRKRYLQKVQYCSILEVIQYLKTGR